MKEVSYCIECLERTPVILNHLLSQIPESRYTEKRVATKWCIHEQVCHLVDAQKILIERFKQFEREKNPLMKSYHPPTGQYSTHYFDKDMKTELARF